MPTMTVSVEVEATPELVEKHLRDYAATLNTGGFPIAAGSMADLDPAVSKAIGAVDGAKVLIVEASKSAPHGLVAFVKAAGGFGVLWAMASQVKVDAPAAQAAESKAPPAT